MKFKQYYNQVLLEVKDTGRNRDALIRAYELPQPDRGRAAELIKLWNMYSPYINKDEDYGFPRNIPQLDPMDIFAWARAATHMQKRGHDEWTKLDALQNLEAMIANLKRVKNQKETRKQQQQDYTVVYKNDQVTVYQPHSEGASCKLGAGTKWCTASTKGVNHFDSYTKQQGVKLFYVITNPQKYNTATAVWPPQAASGPSRAPGRNYIEQEKYAVAEYPDGRREYFDDEDQPLADYDFQEQVIDRFNIDTSGWLKTYTVVEQLKKACMRLSKLADDDDGGIDVTQMSEVQSDIMRIIHEFDNNNREEYKKLRVETGYPDKAFIEVSEKHGLSHDTFYFYMSHKSNPSEDRDDAVIRQYNKEFRYILVDTLLERTELAIRGYGTPDPTGHRYDDDDWKQYNRSLSLLKDHNRIYDLIHYSKIWTGGDWKDLHGATLEVLEELGPQAFTESDPGMLHSGLLRLCLAEKADNRFKQMEHIAAGHMQDAAKKMGLVHPYDLSLGNPGENETMEQWTIQMRRDGWMDFGQRYNLMVAGAQGVNDKVPYIPVVPSAWEKLHDYPMR